MSKFPVVVIDDLYGALEDTSAVLEELGLFQIRGKFTSVRDAELYLINADEKVYIIFCDIEMPDYSGFDAIERIRCYCSHFVFITGYADTYALKGYKVHVDGLLSKPVEADELLDLLKHLQSKAPIAVLTVTSGPNRRSFWILLVQTANSMMHERMAPQCESILKIKGCMRKSRWHLRKLLIWKK